MAPPSAPKEILSPAAAAAQLLRGGPGEERAAVLAMYAGAGAEPSGYLHSVLVVIASTSSLSLPDHTHTHPGQQASQQLLFIHSIPFPPLDSILHSFS